MYSRSPTAAPEDLKQEGSDEIGTNTQMMDPCMESPVVPIQFQQSMADVWWCPIMYGDITLAPIHPMKLEQRLEYEPQAANEGPSQSCQALELGQGSPRRR